MELAFQHPGNEDLEATWATAAFQELGSVCGCTFRVLTKLAAPDPPWLPVCSSVCHLQPTGRQACAYALCAEETHCLQGNGICYPYWQTAFQLCFFHAWSAFLSVLTILKDKALSVGDDGTGTDRNFPELLLQFSLCLYCRGSFLFVCFLIIEYLIFAVQQQPIFFE